MQTWAGGLLADPVGQAEGGAKDTGGGSVTGRGWQRRAGTALGQALLLGLVYREAAVRTARWRARRAGDRWAAVVSTGRRSSAAAPAPATAVPPPGNPRLYLPVGGRGGSVQLLDPSTPVEQRSVVLQEGRLVLGSGPTAGLRVEDPGMAAEHAEVVCDGRTVHLRDLTGTGRVHVDGVPVLDADLVDGNRISVAGHDLVFRRDPVPDDAAGGGRRGPAS